MRKLSNTEAELKKIEEVSKCLIANLKKNEEVSCRGVFRIQSNIYDRTLLRKYKRLLAIGYFCKKVSS